MKKIIISVLFLILGITTCFALEKTNIKVVMEPDFPPYNFYDSQGKPTGIHVELAEAMLKELGREDIKVELIPWARAYEMGLKEKNVLVACISRMPHREKLFKWVGRVAPFGATFIKLKKRKDIIINSLEDAKKYKSAVLKGDSRLQYLETKGFKQDEHLLVTNSNAQSWQLLFKERVDLVPFDAPGVKYLFQKLNNAADNKFFITRIISNNIKLDESLLEREYRINDFSEGLYMAFSDETEDEIVNQFRNAYQVCVSKGLVKQLQKKWDCED